MSGRGGRPLEGVGDDDGLSDDAWAACGVGVDVGLVAPGDGLVCGRWVGRGVLLE